MTPDSSAISWLDESVALGAALAGAAMFGAACTVIGSMVTLFLVAKRKIVAEKRVVVRCDGCGAVVCTACGRICGHESRRPADIIAAAGLLAFRRGRALAGRALRWGMCDVLQAQAMADRRGPEDGARSENPQADVEPDRYKKGM